MNVAPSSGRKQESIKTSEKERKGLISLSCSSRNISQHTIPNKTTGPSRFLYSDTNANGVRRSISEMRNKRRKKEKPASEQGKMKHQSENSPWAMFKEIICG